MSENPFPTTLKVAAYLWLALAALHLLCGEYLLPKELRNSRRTLVVGAIGIALACWLLTGCQPRPLRLGQSQAQAARDVRDAVVLLQCQHVQLTSDSASIVNTPCCSAFTVRVEPGLAGVRLYTAAHCLHGLTPNDDAQYSTRADVERFVHKVRAARVLRVDLDHDRAELTPVQVSDAEALAPVALTLVEPGAVPVHSVSAYYGWATADGVTLGEVWGPSARYYMSDLDVIPGWSGSPVLDDVSGVVGVLTSCEGVEGPPKGCVPRTGNYVAVWGW